MPDFTLYPIHSTGKHVQYAGHVMLWETEEAVAYSIAKAMMFGPIVGVEVVQNNGLGEADTILAPLGVTFTDAVAATEKPKAPYAVMSGLPGYLPNSCSHYPTLREGLEAFAEELDRAINDLAIPDEDDHELRMFMLSDLETVQAALRATGEPIHPEHNLRFGYSSHITTYEWLTLAPIAPEDYKPEEAD